MLKENPDIAAQDELFRTRLENIIDPRHELVRLASLVDWDGLSADLSDFYCPDNGRPGGSIRLMAGLCFLKDLKGLSDEEVCAARLFFQHDVPVKPPSLSIFRGRIGDKGMECLLEETIKLGLQTGTVSKRDLQRVTVDTTVQEKAVHFPTDVRLCHKAREELVALAKREGIESAVKQGLKLSEEFETALGKARIIQRQTLRPQCKEKLYSWHAPEVECIAKGKAHKKYEFGCKASYASTNKSNFIVGAMALHGKPYDGHTLKAALAQIKKLTGITPSEAQVDLGYRGHGLKNGKTDVIQARQKRGVTPAKRKRQKRRNAIEPITGHTKNDRKVGPRNWLQGKRGDKINAIAMAIGFNLRKILRKIFLRLRGVLILMFFSHQTVRQN